MISKTASLLITSNSQIPKFGTENKTISNALFSTFLIYTTAIYAKPYGRCKLKKHSHKETIDNKNDYLATYNKIVFYPPSTLHTAHNPIVLLYEQMNKVTKTEK